MSSGTCHVSAWLQAAVPPLLPLLAAPASCTPTLPPPRRVQIDIFMDRAAPESCILNENSLSSGMLYWGHEPYLTRLWVEPHLKQLYTLRDTKESVLAQ